MNRKNRIISILTGALKPTHLEVLDDSAKHAGHAGAKPDGETHYTVIVTSEVFQGKSKVACHRMVYALLADELKSGLHALAIEAKAP